MLPREVREHDPIEALDGGADGLEAYRIIAATAAAFLEPNGIVAVEIGHDQRRLVSGLFLDQGFALKDHATDLGGRDRALMFAL